MGKSELSLVFSTVDSRENAEGIATKAVDHRLAAGVNIIPGCSSVFRWKGEVEKREEILMVFYTRSNLLEALGTLIRELHPYEVPAITFFSINEGLPEFMEWIGSNTASDIEDY